MKKTLYYVVENEIETGNEECFATGNKTITVYEIIENAPKRLTILECGVEENSKENILEYLEQNFEEEFDLIQL